MATTKKINPITINRPMVLIPAEDYEDLLKEAGLSPTPHLSKDIQNARARFKKGNYLPWSVVKHAVR